MKDVWKGPECISFKSEKFLVTAKWHSQTSTCYKQKHSRVTFGMKFIVTKAKGFPLSTLPKTNSTSDRGSRPEVFCKKGVLRNFAKFTGKHLC